MQIVVSLEGKDGIFVVRSDARVSSKVLKAGARKHELLVTNAVAVSYLMTLIPFPSLFCSLVWDQCCHHVCNFCFLVVYRQRKAVLRLLHQNLGMSLFLITC